MIDLIKIGHSVTYNDPKLFEKFYITEQEDKEQFRNVIYNYDLLMIFNLQDFLEISEYDNIINKITYILENYSK